MKNATQLLDRQTLRQFYRQQRNQLSVQQQENAAQACLVNSLKHTNLSTAKTVACYLANDGELNPKAIIEYCWQNNIRVLLPVLDPQNSGHLVFVHYLANSQMQTNIFGIPEPIITEDKLVDIGYIDLIFTPLVAFDNLGNRLGMGGGFYDRTLAPIKQNNLKTQLIGLAHNCQKTEQLPIDSWDIPLNGIVTSSDFFMIE